MVLTDIEEHKLANMIEVGIFLILRKHAAKLARKTSPAPQTSKTPASKAGNIFSLYFAPLLPRVVINSHPEERLLIFLDSSSFIFNMQFLKQFKLSFLVSTKTGPLNFVVISLQNLDETNPLL